MGSCRLSSHADFWSYITTHFFLRLSKTSLIKHKWHKTEEKSEFLRAPSNLSGIGITGLGMSHVFEEDITITDFNIKR